MPDNPQAARTIEFPAGRVTEAVRIRILAEIRTARDRMAVRLDIFGIGTVKENRDLHPCPAVEEPHGRVDLRSIRIGLFGAFRPVLTEPDDAPVAENRMTASAVPLSEREARGAEFTLPRGRFAPSRG